MEINAFRRFFHGDKIPVFVRQVTRDARLKGLVHDQLDDLSMFADDIRG
ncbi:MAG TPA: hypothetical protein VHA52_02075 [Candidatus Babeliaceae bacterium]|nr:hypothetical protein [Candidatus Babeliaceae bacterium]